jgi:hypothetical protein
MANSGVFLRSARDGENPAFSGCEIQILDDLHWETTTGTVLRPWQFTGSLYGSVPPKDRSALLPPGRWNTFEILYHGPRLRVALNGIELYDVDTRTVPAERPFAERAPVGFIGLQRHAPAEADGEVFAAFRNLWIREIEPSETGD